MSQINQFRYRGVVATITGDIGGAVGADPLNSNLDLYGGNLITITGDPLAYSLTIDGDASIAAQFDTDAGTAIPALNVLTFSGGTNINTSGATSIVTINLDDTITLTQVNATTFDTNIAAAGLTLSGTSLIASGSDANIDVNITSKGSGKVIIDDLRVSALTSGMVVGDGSGNVSTLATTDHTVQVGNAAGSLTSLAVGSTGEILIGNTTADPSWSSTPTVTTMYATTFDTNVATAAVTLSGTTLSADGTDSDIDINITPKGTGALKTTNFECTNFKTPYANTVIIAESGGDYTSIQAALDDNTTTFTLFIVYPGTYINETIHFTANNQTVMGFGVEQCIVSGPVDDNIVLFGSYTLCEIKNLYISNSGATDLKHTVYGTDGSLIINNCNIYMTNSSVTSADQPSCIKIDGTGIIYMDSSNISYENNVDDGTGSTAIKSAILTSSSSRVEFKNSEAFLNCSNQALATTLSYSIDSSTVFVYRSYITISDPDGTYVIGFYYPGSGESEINKSTFNITGGTTNFAFGLEIQGTCTVRSSYNRYNITSTGGNTIPFFYDTGTTLHSQFDDITAAGYPTGSGTYTYLNSLENGKLKTQVVYGITFDTDIALEGVTLSGTSLIADGTETNIDINITSKGGGHVVLDSLKVSDFTAGTLRADGSGNISSLADGNNGEILIGKTGDLAMWGTLTDGNNITCTEGANSISIAVTGTTEHAVQLGNASGSLSSLILGTQYQVLQSGGASGDPAWSTTTYPSTLSKGDILVVSADNTITALSPSTAGYVLTDNGAGNVPSWQSASGVNTTYHTDSGDATESMDAVTFSGGTNINTSGTSATVTINLDTALTGLNSITINNGGSIQSSTSSSDVLYISAYDVDGTAYKPFITLTSADTPTCDLDTSVTIGTKYIYRADGTDVAVADGGTGQGSYTVGDILYASAATTLTPLAATTANYVLTTNGATTAPSYQYSHALPVLINTQTDSYQLVLGDAGKLIKMNKGTANTLTIPKDATVDHATGTQILVMQYGAGATTIAPEDGTITIRYDAALTLVLNGQYALAACIKIDDNEWVCGGNLTPA